MKRKEFIRRIGRDDAWSSQAILNPNVRVCANHCSEDADHQPVLLPASQLDVQMQNATAAAPASVNEDIVRHIQENKRKQEGAHEVRPAPKLRLPSDAPSSVKETKDAQILRL